MTQTRAPDRSWPRRTGSADSRPAARSCTPRAPQAQQATLAEHCDRERPRACSSGDDGAPRNSAQGSLRCRAVGCDVVSAIRRRHTDLTEHAHTVEAAQKLVIRRKKTSCASNCSLDGERPGRDAVRRGDSTTSSAAMYKRHKLRNETAPDSSPRSRNRRAAHAPPARPSP